jgi:hypothetical protein
MKEVRFLEKGDFSFYSFLLTTYCEVCGKKKSPNLQISYILTKYLDYSKM